MLNQKIDRHQFLKKAGFKGAALFAVYCAGVSCLPEEATPLQEGVLLSLDLTNSNNSNLNEIGGYIVQNTVVVARTTDGFIAATQICSHENKRGIIFKNDEFYCTDHGARFDQAGKGLNKDGSKGIKIYTVSKNGNTLTVSA